MEYHQYPRWIGKKKEGRSKARIDGTRGPENAVDHGYLDPRDRPLFSVFCATVTEANGKIARPRTFSPGNNPRGGRSAGPQEL